MLWYFLERSITIFSGAVNNRPSLDNTIWTLRSDDRDDGENVAKKWIRVILIFMVTISTHLQLYFVKCTRTLLELLNFYEPVPKFRMRKKISWSLKLFTSSIEHEIRHFSS